MAIWRQQSRHVCWSRVLLLVSAASMLHATSAADPVFSNAPYVATLSETASTTTTLVTFTCTDADNDTTVVKLPTGGVAPVSPCGTCFTLLPCTLPAYCLIYNPGIDSLNQQDAPTYSITVECTDGTTTVSTEVDLRLRPNSPPRFNPNTFVATTTISNTKNKNAGFQVYEVMAVDDENDAITFSMTSDPASSNFEIGSGDGIIRAKNDLVSECTNSITFYVNISDGFNSPVGPLAVITTLDGANEAPDITNLDVSIQVPEDTAANSAIRTIAATDDDSVNRLTYTLTANPAANLGFFQIVGGELQLKRQLNYETASERHTDLTIVASDGACTSPAHYVDVTVTDVNEEPDLQPKNAAYSVYEGTDFGTTLNINWDVVDPDFVDSHTFSIIDGNDLNHFSINPTSGQLTVNGDYDIDNSNNPTTQTLTVQVTDKGGLTSNTTVTLNFKDRNDIRPVIAAGDFDFNVCETRRLGANLGTMTCTDGDLTSPNNDTYFTGGGSGITVLGSGGIVMGTRPALGQTFTTTASCSDRGVFPSSLSSASPVTISITTVECPTTIPPTPAPTTTTPAPTTTTTPTTTTPAPTDNIVSWIDENLWWIILSALLLTTLLGLWLWMMYIYCLPKCRQCCKKQCCRRPSRKTRRIKTPPREKTPPPAIPPPKTPPVETPPPPAIVGDPNSCIEDFWKEKYWDDDYGKQPDRNSKPRPLTPEFCGNGSGNVPAERTGGLDITPPKEKPRRCNIL